jgi:hypothetical protein
MKIRGCFSNERRISGDRNAPPGRRRNVNPGRGGRHRSDQLEIRARVNHLSVHAVVEQADEIVIAPERRHQLRLGYDVCGIGIQLHTSQSSKSSQCLFGNRLRDKDSWGHWLFIPVFAGNSATLIAEGGKSYHGQSGRRIERTLTTIAQMT